MKKTFGILAHVDAGKTTFSEQILYHTAVIRNPGRVDHKETFLDCHSIEKNRGITVFQDQASFSYRGDDYYLVDTPGHVDFSAEMERAIEIMDYAILIVSGVDGVQGHTDTVWKLLREYNVPTFLFLNKTDINTVDRDKIKQEMCSKLSGNILFIEPEDFSIQNNRLCLSGQLQEEAAASDEELLEAYLEESDIDWQAHLRELIQEEKIFPCMCGSALKDDGIEEFLTVFHYLTVTGYHVSKDRPFAGRIYKVRYNQQGERLTFIKALSGSLSVKDEISVWNQNGQKTQEKINQIRLFQGQRSTPVRTASAGDLFAVTGISQACPGDGAGDCKEKVHYRTLPALKAKVLYDPSVPAKDIVQVFRILEAEDPALKCSWESSLEELHVSIMGKIQLEVLTEIVRERFGYQIDFDRPRVMYMETIGSPVMGYGHFEPLRHYAEAALKLEPAARGSGITCDSICHVDDLASNFQKLILTHIMEKEHIGILTGSPITDIRITLVKGISHIKHTEGGDFREAVYRAIRQGLEKADNILLEPMYEFSIEAEQEYTGRIISDITRMAGEFADPVMRDQLVIIKGRGPAASFMNYAGELLSFTKGKGRISLRMAGYDICHNTEEIIKNRNYEKDRDLENISSSVFCAKGTSFVVKWDEAEQYMHCLK